MNNNSNPNSKAKCKCGRYMTLGEESGGVNPIGYECPDCKHRKFSKPLTREEYYNQFTF